MGIILLLFQTSIFTDPNDMQLPLFSWLAELFVLLTISTIYCVVLQSETVSDKVTTMLRSQGSRKTNSKARPKLFTHARAWLKYEGQADLLFLPAGVALIGFRQIAVAFPADSSWCLRSHVNQIPVNHNKGSWQSRYKRLSIREKLALNQLRVKLPT